jgi:hypothetical protein
VGFWRHIEKIFRGPAGCISKWQQPQWQLCYQIIFLIRKKYGMHEGKNYLSSFFVSLLDFYQVKISSGKGDLVTSLFS